MEDEPHSPYHSTRVRIADITSPKNLVGLKEFTIEITYGNQDTKKVIKNKDDVLDTEDRDLFGEIEAIFVQRDKWAESRKFRFIDQLDKVTLDSLVGNK